MGAIINFFKGLLGAITGLFSKKGEPKQVAAKPKKGKDGFLMEAPPIQAAPAAPTVKAAVAPAPAAPPAVADEAAKGGKAAKKTKGKAGKAATAVAAAAVATVAAVPQAMDPADIINAAIATASQATNTGSATGQAGGATFAEMNAVPMSTGARRRPGANMTGFMDMAKTMRSR